MEFGGRQGEPILSGGVLRDLGTGALVTFFCFASPSFEFYLSVDLKCILECKLNCLKKNPVWWSRKGLENSLIGLCSPLRLKKFCGGLSGSAMAELRPE